MKKIFRSLAIFLITSMLLTMHPLHTFTMTSNNKVEKSIVPSTSYVAETNEVEIIGEVLEKREQNVKHFLRKDMSYIAAVYPTAVHYKEGGKWKDIDNSLLDTVDEESNEAFENADNSYKIKISKSINSKKLVSIKKDKYEISWNIVNAKKSKAQKNANNDFSQKSINNEKMSLEKLQSNVIFPEIFAGIDLEYCVLPEEIKENIILKEKADVPELRFQLHLKNLTPRLENDNRIVFYDNKSNSPVMEMPKPLMYDSADEVDFNYEIELALNEIGNGYEIILSPNKTWLNDEARVYPIIIDPVIKTSLASNKIFDATVTTSNPDTNYLTGTLLRVGYGDTTKINRSYIAFTLPTLTSADLITNATLELTTNLSCTLDRQIEVYKVLGPWSSSTITWNNKPAYDSHKIEDYEMVSGPNSSKFTWDITGMAKEWYTSGINNGLMLKNRNETTAWNYYLDFYSSDISDSNAAKRPNVLISYVNNSGLEGYWTYHSQSVGRAGTGHINDYNGNLVFAHNDLSMNGNRMPVTINHIFNSNERNLSSIGFGCGWRLNLTQRVVPEVIDGTQYYAYIDEDGTRHYFLCDASNSKWVDESGIDLNLTINTSSTTEKYTIKDKEDNKLIFNSSGYLVKIQDRNNNAINLTYTGTSLTKVIDGAGR